MKNKVYLLVAFSWLPNLVNAQNIYPPSGNVGIGTTAPLGGVHVKASPSWSSHNFGACFIADGPRNNAVALLDSTSSNPWAIVNAGGLFSIAKMPPIGNVTSSPEYYFNVLTNGN